jgi:hypothetical protein
MTTRLVKPVALVGVFRHRGTVDQVLEHHLALDFGEDRTGVGVPFGQTLAAADLRSPSLTSSLEP